MAFGCSARAGLPAEGKRDSPVPGLAKPWHCPGMNPANKIGVPGETWKRLDRAHGVEFCLGPKDEARAHPKRGAKGMPVFPRVSPGRTPDGPWKSGRRVPVKG